MLEISLMLVSLNSGADIIEDVFWRVEGAISV